MTLLYVVGMFQTPKAFLDMKDELVDRNLEYLEKHPLGMGCLGEVSFVSC